MDPGSVKCRLGSVRVCGAEEARDFPRTRRVSRAEPTLFCYSLLLQDFLTLLCTLILFSMFLFNNLLGR